VLTALSNASDIAQQGYSEQGAPAFTLD